MFKLCVEEERSLKAVCDGVGNEPLIIRKGAWIAGSSPMNYRFDKMIFGPGNSIGNAILGSLKRGFTGENIPLVRVIPNGPSKTYYAINALNVSVLTLGRNDELTIESEYLLAFYDCDYNVKFMGKGILSQGGMFASVLRGKSNNAQVAVISNGDIIQLQTPCACDPDAYICHTGDDPNIKTDISWKTFLKQESGESYMFDFTRPGQMVLIQPSERAGGIHLGID